MIKNPITDDELDDLDSLCRAATEGPWTLEMDWTWELQRPGKRTIKFMLGSAGDEGADAKLMAACREWIPRLIEEIQETRVNKLIEEDLNRGS